MRKTVPYFFIGLVLFALLFIGTNITSAQQLLDNYLPEVSFGDLLSGYQSTDVPEAPQPEVSVSVITVTPAVNTESESSRVEATNKIKEYLKGMSTMDDFTRNSLQEFLVKSTTFDPSGNRQIIKPSHIDTETKPSPDPSPYIPIPTLMAGVREVLGIQTEPTNPVPSDNVPSQTNPSSTTHNLQLTTKSIYTIALLGDSMTNTLGNDLPHLRSFLSQTYPFLSFALLNYGFGATDL